MAGLGERQRIANPNTMKPTPDIPSNNDTPPLEKIINNIRKNFPNKSSGDQKETQNKTPNDLPSAIEDLMRYPKKYPDGITIPNLLTLKQIGEGNFGKGFLATFDNNKTFFIKSFKQQDSAEMEGEMEKEKEITSTLMTMTCKTEYDFLESQKDKIQNNFKKEANSDEATRNFLTQMETIQRLYQSLSNDNSPKNMARWSALISTMKDAIDKYKPFTDSNELTFPFPQVYSLVNTVDGQSYLTMEYFKGVEFSDENMNKNEHKKEIVLSLVNKLLQLHKMGLTHNDIKQGNILISPSGDATFVDTGGVEKNKEYMPDWQALAGTCLASLGIKIGDVLSKIKKLGIQEALQPMKTELLKNLNLSSEQSSLLIYLSLFSQRDKLLSSENGKKNMENSDNLENLIQCTFSPTPECQNNNQQKQIIEEIKTNLAIQ